MLIAYKPAKNDVTTIINADEFKKILEGMNVPEEFLSHQGLLNNPERIAPLVYLGYAFDRERIEKSIRDEYPVAEVVFFEDFDTEKPEDHYVSIWIHPNHSYEIRYCKPHDYTDQDAIRWLLDTTKYFAQEPQYQGLKVD